LEKTMNLAAVSVASSAHAALFAEASASSHGSLATVSIDECGTVVPRKPGTNPPPPPPSFDGLAQFAGVASLPVSFSEDGPRCGNEPRTWPFPPPPPPPFVSDFSQAIG
jgi:hypothetical protein